MVDDFNTNSDSNANLDSDMFGEEQKPKLDILAAIKPYTGIIIKVLILLVILGAAYWFFFMRYATVSFDVIANGASVTTTIKLENSGKSMPVDTLTDTKLLPGDYTVSFDDPDLSNYYLQNNTVSVSKDNEGTPITIKLYPTWSKDIVKSEFKITKRPANVYTGQSVQLEINITNKGKPIGVTLRGDGDANISQDVDLKTGTNKVIVDFDNVKKTGENLKETFYLDGAKDILKISDFNAIIKKAPSVKLNSKTIYQTGVGNTLRITFELVNSSQDKIEGLDFNIVSASRDPEVIAGWIVNTPTDVNIIPNGSTSVDVDFNIPLKKVDGDMEKINLTFGFSNSYINLTKNVELDLLPIEFVVPKKIDLEPMTAGTTKTEKITIENKTDYSIDLKDSSINSSNPKLASPDVMSLDLPSTIPPGKLDISLNIAIPPTFESDKTDGTIVISTDFGDYSIPFTLNITGINLKIELPTLQPTYTFTFDQDTAPSKQGNLMENTIKNSGNIDVNIVSLQISPNCTKFITIAPFNPLTLKIGDQEKFYISLNPIQKSLLNTPILCSLNITYQDPTTQTIQVLTNNTFTIPSAT